MKILLVAERYWPEVGAAPSRLANMAEGLQGLGHEVDVLTSLPNYPKGCIFKAYRKCLSKRETRKGVSIFRYWVFATVSQRALLRALNMFSFAFIIWLFAFKRRRVKAYDRVIIQTPTLVAALSAMVLFKAVYGKTCILNVSDIWPLTAVDMGVMKEGSFAFRFMAWCERYLYRKADGIVGQSREILAHVARHRHQGPLFLYRNLQKHSTAYDFKEKGTPLKLAFCGMLGVAQNVAGIVKNVPFKELGVEFHILGGGAQLAEIEDYCEHHPDCRVYTHGFVPKDQIADRLKDIEASIVPLAAHIRGAVPSKIYDILPQGLPILFCGCGEGADFIRQHGVGLVSQPGDYDGLTENIRQLRDMPAEDFRAMSASCIQTSRSELDFDLQLRECVDWLETLHKTIYD